MRLIDKVIKLVGCLLADGETSIEIYMHNTYATVITDGAIKKIRHIDYDKEDEETT